MTAVTPPPLPQWPEAGEYAYGGDEQYQCARAAYWEARCRLACEVLEQVHLYSRGWSNAAGAALALIGPLPDLPTDEVRG